MITTAIALLIAVQAQQQDTNSGSKSNAAAILSKAFSRYANAQSLAGTIKTTQSATGGGQTVTINTQIELQYDRPSKIYLHESRNGSKGGQWLLVSDGKTFGYDRPKDEYGPARYMEYVTQHDKPQTIADLYTAASASLGELNPILDIAISSVDRLKLLKDQWASLHLKGKQTVNGQVANIIEGDWKEQPGLAPSGQFEADVTDDGEVVRYVVIERFLLPTGDKSTGAQPIYATTKTQWDADLKIGPNNDQGAYRVH